MCQCHGSELDVTTGAVVSGPASQPLNVYEVEVVDGSIRIRALRGYSLSSRSWRVTAS